MSASAKSAAGMYRRRPGAPDTMFGSSAGVDHARGLAGPAPVEQDVAEDRDGNGEEGEQQVGRLEAHDSDVAPPQEGGKLAKPVALGRERDVAHTGCR